MRGPPGSSEIVVGKFRALPPRRGERQRPPRDLRANSLARVILVSLRRRTDYRSPIIRMSGPAALAPFPDGTAPAIRRPLRDHRPGSHDTNICGPPAVLRSIGDGLRPETAEAPRPRSCTTGRRITLLPERAPRASWRERAVSWRRCDVCAVPSNLSPPSAASPPRSSRCGGSLSARDGAAKRSGPQHRPRRGPALATPRTS